MAGLQDHLNLCHPLVLENVSSLVCSVEEYLPVWKLRADLSKAMKATVGITFCLEYLMSLR